MEIQIESLQQRQLSLVGQNFSWLEQVSHGLTRRTTTTSGKPLKCSSKLLQAEQKLKQGHEDLPLLAHYLWRNSIQSCVPSGKKIEYSSSSWSITSRRRRCDWILEIKRLSSERFWELSTLVSWCVEEQNARKRRQQGKIPVLYWSPGKIHYLRALQGHSGRNLIDPSLQDDVLIPDDFIECILSRRMCNQFTFHHKFRIDTGRTHFVQGKTVFFTAVNPVNKETQRSGRDWLDRTTSCIIQATKVEKTPRHSVLGRYTICLTERIEVLSNKIERNHPSRHTPSFLYPGSCCDGIGRNNLRDSVYVTSTSSKDFL